jgi:hypothetical protein
MGRSFTVEQGTTNGEGVGPQLTLLAGAQAHELLKLFHKDETKVSGIDKVAERLRLAAFETLFTAFDSETLIAYLRQELKGVVDINTPVITVPSRPTFSPDALVVEATLGNRKSQEQTFTVCLVQVDTFSCIYVFPWVRQADNS